MKRVDIYIPEEDLSAVTEILHKYEVGGITVYDIRGRSKVPHEPVPEMVRNYMTGKKISPEYLSRRKVEVVVPDSQTKSIVEALYALQPKRGKVFIQDISEAHDIAKKTSGESALS
jgi:nitrogen regulatory protein P-II 1